MWNSQRSYTRIKLCWFEQLEAAYEASAIGADALGFHILQAGTSDWRSKARHFGALLQALPDGIEKVLLTDYPREVITEILSLARFDSVQLYPDWDSADVIRLRSDCQREIKIIKVMSAQQQENSPADPATFMARYSECVDAFLLDSFREGGTGVLADQEHCAWVVRCSPLPVFIAGGLTPLNVAQRVRAIRPFGVDVESGVSDKVSGFGMLKNLEKCRRFVDAVVRVDRELLRGK